MIVYHNIIPLAHSLLDMKQLIIPVFNLDSNVRGVSYANLSWRV